MALHFVYYNFCRIHKTLRMTPAMAAGVTALHSRDVALLLGTLHCISCAAVAPLQQSIHFQFICEGRDLVFVSVWRKGEKKGIGGTP